ncbi:MAG: MarR family transcriptional regulator [Candidatus Omnitrophica bacterium]|nr:MarR family transcriptional regulator [Candidatus Omnitrophota bacterium]
MTHARKIAREVSLLIPKLVVSIRQNFFEIEELTNRQIVTLMYISESDRPKLTDIAENFQVSAPTVSGVVDRLTRKGYLRRERDQQDRRVVYVVLSRKGTEFIERFRKTIQQRWETILDCLSRAEQEEYLRILRKILKNMTGRENA